MKKPGSILLFLLFILLLTGCNYVEEKKAENIIQNYYQAIIDEEYEKAFKQLHLYDTEESKLADKTGLSEQEAKAIYLEKINQLEEQKYKLKNFEIVEIEYEDGHSFWHHIKLEVEQDGEKSEWNEVAYIVKGKLLIGERDDPYGKYRDGKMLFEEEK